MGKKMFGAALLVAVIAICLSSSGCTSSGQSTAGMQYTNQTEVLSGMINITASLPIWVYPEGRGMPDPSTYGRDLPKQVWVGAAYEDEKGIDCAFYTDVGNLSDLDINVTMPNGKTAYARNFSEVQDQNGNWSVIADHKGFDNFLFDYHGSGILPLYFGEGRSDDWDNETSVPIGGKTLKDQRIQVALGCKTTK